MDPTRDNPIIRFTTFWWAIGSFLVFAVLLAVIFLFNRKSPETLEDVVAKARYETKVKVDQAQAEALSKEAIEAAIPVVAGKIAASKPVAVEKPDQVVPGSATAAKLAAAPAVDTAAVDAAPRRMHPSIPLSWNWARRSFSFAEPAMARMAKVDPPARHLPVPSGSQVRFPTSSASSFVVSRVPSR
jgi:hypothetical protein